MKNLKTLILLTGIFANLMCETKGTQEKYQENWAFYLTTVDENLSSISTDLNLIQKAPIKEQSSLTFISISMNSAREDGLSSEKESKILWDIEETLISKLESSKLDFSYVGRLTSNGFRELYLYSNNKIIAEQRLSNGMTSFNEYKFEIDSQEDPNWKSYFEFLYPNQEQMQTIQNYSVLLNLEEHGDDLSKKREVFHWIYFKTESELNTFEDYTLNKGFKTINKGKTESDSDYGYNIQISRIDKVGYEEIDEYTLDLWQKAKDLNGDYDGWETSIEK
jgi:uncharacterized protein (TIGR01619 family)